MDTYNVLALAMFAISGYGIYRWLKELFYDR